MKYRILTIAVLSLVFLAANTGIFGQNTKVSIKNAEAAIEKKDFDGALKILNTVLAKQPKNAAALTQKSRALYFQGKLAEAVAEADKAIAADPNSPVAYNLRGNAKKDLNKDPSDALADFEKAVALDPKNPKALINRGMMYWNFGKFDLALADMNRAVELAPLDNYYSIRGSFYLFRKDYAKAVEDYTKAIELAPANDNYYANRAEIYYSQSKLITDETVGKAKADADKSLSINPQNARALFVRGRLKYNFNDPTGALTDVLAARKLNPNLAGLEIIYETNWSKTPDNLRLELNEPVLAKYKDEFEKDLANPDVQDKLERAFWKIPEAAAKADPAKYYYVGYLDALLKNDPNNPCLNRYRLKRINADSAGSELWRLPQYEADVARLTNAPTAEKYKSCAAEMARDVAFKRYDLARRKDSNSFKESFTKSAEWATKANQILSGSGDEILNNLDKLADEYRDYELGSMKGDPRYADFNNRVLGDYANYKARIRLARAQSKSGESDSAAVFDDDKINKLIEVYVQALKNDRAARVVYDDFKTTYRKKYESKSISDRLIDGKEFYMTLSERTRFKQSKTEAEAIIANYKNFLAKYRDVLPQYDAQAKAKSVEPPSETINKNIEYWTNELRYINGELAKLSN